METIEAFMKNQFLFFSRLNLYTVHTLFLLQIYRTTTTTTTTTKQQRTTAKQGTWMTVLRTLLEVLRKIIAGHTYWHMHKQISKSSKIVQLFSKCILDAFTKDKSSRTVKEWTCCMEDHADGGKHYRMSLDLSGTRG